VLWRQGRKRKRPRRSSSPTVFSTAQATARRWKITKGKLVILAGQMPVDDKGQLVGGGDFKAQATRAFQNIVLALKAAGLDTSDYFIVGDLQKNLPLLRQALPPFFKPGAPRPAGTVAGVTGLALEGQMIEIDVTAVSRD
jgi:enamine deaminase RidA (YjgF/YER057c/UK114 family)